MAKKIRSKEMKRMLREFATSRKVSFYEENKKKIIIVITAFFPISFLVLLAISLNNEQDREPVKSGFVEEKKEVMKKQEVTLNKEEMSMNLTEQPLIDAVNFMVSMIWILPVLAIVTAILKAINWRD